MTLQLLVAPWLQSRLGLGATLMVLPIALIGGTAAVAVHATLVTSSALRVTEGGVKSAIYRPMWEQIFLPIERRYRGMAKVLTDGISARFAEGIGAAALYSWLVQEPFQHLSLPWMPWAYKERPSHTSRDGRGSEGGGDQDSC